MRFDLIKSGKNFPEDINVVIEIPMNGDPIKYEIDKESGMLCVDRFIHTSMRYPCNYGFIPNTMSSDGDPLDVLVITRFPLIPGCFINCIPIGVLLMEDESGKDEKIIAVPHEKIHMHYTDIKNITDLPQSFLDEISHFFERYKELESKNGKWAKVTGFKDSSEAKKIIISSQK